MEIGPEKPVTLAQPMHVGERKALVALNAAGAPVAQFDTEPMSHGWWPVDARDLRPLPTYEDRSGEPMSPYGRP